MWALIVLGCIAAAGSALIVMKTRHAKPASNEANATQSMDSSNGNGLTTKLPGELDHPILAGKPDAEPVVSSTISKPSESKSRRPLVMTPKPRPQETVRSTVRAHAQLRNQKKRLFDYNRYFADLMSSVSGHMAYAQQDAAVRNGQNGMAAFPEGYQASANGAPQTANGHGTSTGRVDSSRDLFSTAEIQSQMIATQKALIEEQRRLIHEQSKLIEEKSKLIQEKNRLLDRQSEMLDQKLL